MATLNDFLDKATDGVLVDDVFAKIVEQREVKEWPIRLRRNDTKNVRYLLWEAEFELPPDTAEL